MANAAKMLVRFVLAVGACSFAAGARAEDAAIDFRHDIRPILSNACFGCHGPDEAARQAGLRLDLHDGILATLESGRRAVVPGDAAQSAMIERITSADSAMRMPPSDSGKELTPEQIELLRRWVESGAPWAEHWAFVPPAMPAVPAVGNTGSVRNPLDAFVLARLESEGLSPSPSADRVTLLRRLSLDLTGLPPTIAEVDAWLADTADGAFDRAVERLLASPHYGERWGRLWLDAARYADSDGYEKDKSRQVWFYRDWVVGALNRDLPYDQFVVEQIAGDLLPAATQDQIVATGFLRNSMINEEGGVDPEQFRMEAMFDRMDAIGKGMLGLTIQCAQCHDHKFDPLTQRDYYRLFAYINDTHEASIAAYTADEQSQRAAIFAEIAAIEAELRQQRPGWAEDATAWEAAMTADRPEWTVVVPEVDASGGQKHYVLPDGSILAAGYAPTKHETSFSIRTDVAGITAVRLELLNDPNLPLGGPGRSIYGTCALTEFKLTAAPADAPDQVQELTIVSATADVNPAEAELLPIFHDKTDRRRVTGPIAYAIDRVDETAWGIDAGAGRSNVARNAVFVLEAPVSHPAGTILTFKLQQNHGGWNSDDNQNNNLGRFRLAVTTHAAATADSLPAEVRAILSVPRDQRSEEQQAKLFGAWRTSVPEWQAANDAIEALWRQHPAGASQLVLGGRSEPRQTHLLMRGDFLKPAEAIQPGVPEWLHPLAESSEPPRLRFARWLVDRRSPTAARSIVNRVWQAYFGTGLVSTSEDLGAQAETPSHPQLLDWLAVEFMDGGWSLKQLHRTITGSAAYQQSSSVDVELLARDPANRLLARASRMRVEAEGVRDVALSASGLLNPALGGPSVYPPAPDFLFLPPASYGPKTWREETGSNRYRRALYTFRYRSVPYPMLQAFDAPNGDASCVRRVQSNTPVQALTTLNEPMFLECARALALTSLRAGGTTDAERLTYAFRRCTARPPTEQEAAILLDLLARQTERFSAVDAQPWLLAAADPNQPPPLPDGASPAQLAAWTAVARVLLNLDETITRE